MARRHRRRRNPTELGGVGFADLFVAGVGAEADHLAVEKFIDPLASKMLPGVASSTGWKHNLIDLLEKSAAAAALTFGTHKLAGPRWGRDVAYGSGGLVFASLIGDMAPGTAGVGASFKQVVGNVIGSTPAAAPAATGAAQAALPAGGSGLTPAQQAAAAGMPNVPTAVSANSAVGL